MATKRVSFLADDPKERLEELGAVDELLFTGNNFSEIFSYPKDWKPAPPAFPGVAAAVAVPKPSTVPTGLTWGSKTISLAPGQAPAAAFVTGAQGPRRFAGVSDYLTEGPQVSMALMLPSVITGLSGTGGEVFAGFLDAAGENGIKVGLDVASTNLRAFFALVVGGAEIVRSGVSLASSSGANQWCHIRVHLQRQNTSANDYVPRVGLHVGVGTDGEEKILPPWGTRIADATVSEGNFQAILDAFEADGGGFHAVGVEPHSVNEWSALLGHVSIL